MSLVPPHLPSPAATALTAATPDDQQIQQHPTTPFPPPPQSQLDQDNTTNGDEGLDQPSIRAKVEAKLLSLSQELYELEICAGDVVPGQEGRIPEALKRVNELLVELEGLSGKMTDSIPRSVIENVDTYRNPHTYTKNSISRATGENQYALGRILGLESFRRQLHDSIGSEFPAVPLPERRHVPLQREHANGQHSVSDTDGQVKQEGTGNGEEAKPPMTDGLQNGQL